MSEAAEGSAPAAAVMRTPRSVDVDIIARCNLRCRYCYFADNPAQGARDLPTEEWLRFFAELGRLKVMRVSISGGEPLLRGDLPTLLDGIAGQRMRWSLVSNGTLVDDRVAGVLAEIGRCDSIQVSLDGSNPASHDSCRGAGSFVAALGGIRALLRHRLPATVRVTVHRHNVGDLEATAGLLLDELGLPGFTLNAAAGLGACPSSGVGLDVAAYEQAMAILDRLGARYPGRISAQAGPLADLQRWREMEAARRDGAEPFADGGRLTACGCVFDKIAVRADGAVVPCILLAEHELGRISRDRLEELWRDSPLMKRLRDRQRIPLTSFETCAGCAYIPYCTGNCPALAEAATGELDRPSPDGCLRRFLDRGGRLPEPAVRPVATAENG